MFDRVLRKTTGHGLGGKSARAFIDGWLATTRNEVSPATFVRYDQAARLFLKSLGGRADQDFSAIRKEDIAAFRNEQGRRVAASTANLMLKIVKIIFAAAEADGLLLRNEARTVKRLKADADRVEKRAFKLIELKTLLASCDDEWRSLVLFGFYSAPGWEIWRF